ncbi:MAG: Lrp/AsnC family transcriptional regulator [Pseudomonadota bacterium]
MAGIDEFDRKILRSLSRDGRLTHAKLADEVGLSVSACHRRVQELERSGVIKGYRAVLDPHHLDRDFIAIMTVALGRHTKNDQENFERAMDNASQVTECYNVTGAIEYVLKVEVADLAAYKQFHTEVLGQQPGVIGITSYIVMDTTKSP